jgi:hypothetical protein
VIYGVQHQLHLLKVFSIVSFVDDYMIYMDVSLKA